MWQYLVEEYARHNGHADLIREGYRRLGRHVSRTQGQSPGPERVR
jgi:hypothetical protein